MSQELLTQFAAMAVLADQIEGHREWYVYYQGLADKEGQNETTRQNALDQAVMHKRFMKDKAKELGEMATRLSRAVVA